MRDAHNAAMELLEQFTRRLLTEPFLQGLLPDQWAILRTVAAGDEQACTLRQIAASLGVDDKSASRAVLALARRGYLALEAEADPAVGLATLAEPGAALLSDDPIERLDGALIRLSQTDKRELCRMLEIVLEGLATDESEYLKPRRAPARPARPAGPTRPQGGEGRKGRRRSRSLAGVPEEESQA